MKANRHQFAVLNIAAPNDVHPNKQESNTMNRTLTAGALLTGLLLGACATPADPPALVEARATLRSAQLDSSVVATAPLELKKATDSLNQANALQAKGESAEQVSSAAYVANQQAKTAMAVARTKGNETAIRGAELDRERARADARSIEAQRAQAQTTAAQAQTGAARTQAAAAEQRASGAEQRASGAEQRASGAEQRASGAEQRAMGAEQQSAVAQISAIEARQQADQLQQRLNDLQAKQTERGTLVTLGDVLFEFNRAEVKPGALASLRKLSDFLQQYPSRSILIEGHTDNVGSTAANLALSLRRADAVRGALVGMGLSPQRAQSVGYGEQYPIADNLTDTNRALNRRVEVYIAENNQRQIARH